MAGGDADLNIDNLIARLLEGKIYEYIASSFDLTFALAFFQCEDVVQERLCK